MFPTFQEYDASKDAIVVWNITPVFANGTFAIGLHAAPLGIALMAVTPGPIPKFADNANPLKKFCITSELGNN